MSSKETSEVIDLTADLTDADLTDADRRKNEAIIRFYHAALERAIPLIEPGSVDDFARRCPQPPAPDASLSDKHSYYIAAVNHAGNFLQGEQRYVDVMRRDKEPMENWEKGASVMLRIYFGPLVKPSAMFFPLWMEPVLSEVGIRLLAHKSKGVSRSDPTLMLACLGLGEGSTDPPLVYVCKPDEFFVAWVPDELGCEQEPDYDISDIVWEKARATLKEGRTYRDWAKVGQDFAARFKFIQDFGIERAMEFEHAQGAGYSVGPEAPSKLLGALRVNGGKAFGADGTPLW
jgi:hypothetical protein